jgi:hypothetical protein
MDAMDEGGGGRGWEKLAPEERVKLLRERRAAEPEPESAYEQRSSTGGSSSGSADQGFWMMSPSR